jgi:hypothetical protein
MRAERAERTGRDRCSLTLAALLIAALVGTAAVPQSTVSLPCPHPPQQRRCIWATASQTAFCRAARGVHVQQRVGRTRRALQNVAATPLVAALRVWWRPGRVMWAPIATITATKTGKPACAVV